MVKKPRVEVVSSRRTTVDRRIPAERRTGDLNPQLSSSDDEAPEEVTFEDSKAQAIHSMRQALEAARREKELLKEKRRKRQELFQQQKKRKLLPDDVLEELGSTPPEKQNEAEDEAEEEEHTEKRKTGRERNTKTIGESYTVTTVKQCSAERSQQEAAEDFLRSRLYGPGSRRTTCNEMLSLQNKKGPKKSAAVQFVKKDWACQQKARAEKLKKRWIHRQQNPS